MIFEIGGRTLDFGEDNAFKFAFPLTCGKSQLLVDTTIEKVQDDDILSCYSCGDMLNDIDQLMASTECGASALNKLTMKVYIKRDGKKHSEVGSCSALACQKHTFTVMIQTLFVSGMVTTYRVEYMKHQTKESEEGSDNPE
jgi:hypothetical protein